MHFKKLIFFLIVLFPLISHADDIPYIKGVRARAEKGIASDQVILGMKYDQGDGVPKDAAEAMKWYRKAADQGYEPAKKILALPTDSEGLNALRKSAENGNA